MPAARALLWVGFVVGSAERAQGQIGGIVCVDSANYTDSRGSDCASWVAQGVEACLNESDSEINYAELIENCPVACGDCPTAAPTSDPTMSPSNTPTTWDPASSPTNSYPATSVPTTSLPNTSTLTMLPTTSPPTTTQPSYAPVVSPQPPTAQPTAALADGSPSDAALTDPAAPSAAPTIMADMSARGTTSAADATSSLASTLVWGVVLLMVLPCNMAFLVYSRRARKRREDSRSAVAVTARSIQMNRGFMPSRDTDTAVSATALEAGLAEPSAAGLAKSGCGQPDRCGTPVYQDVCTKPAHAESSGCPSTSTLVGTINVNRRDTAYLAPVTHNPEYVYSTATQRDTRYLVPVTDNPKDADNTANHRDTKYLVPVTHNPQYVDCPGGAASPEYADVEDADLTSTNVEDADLASTNVDELRVEGLSKDEDPGLADRERVDVVDQNTVVGYTVITGGHSRSSSVGTEAPGTAPHLYEYCELKLVFPPQTPPRTPLPGANEVRLGLAQASVSVAESDNGGTTPLSNSPYRS